MAAGSWPADRIHNSYPEISNVCPRCNNAVEKYLHTFWQCPHNHVIDDPIIGQTKALEK